MYGTCIKIIHVCAVRRKVNLLTTLNFNQPKENLIRQTTNENKANCKMWERYI